MFSKLSLVLGILIAVPATAGDRTTLFCRPHSEETWVGKLLIDLDSRRIDWGSEQMEIQYVDDLYIFAATIPDGRLRGISLLIERDTGAFWRASVGKFCTDVDCSDTVVGAFTDEGTCRKQDF